MQTWGYMEDSFDVEPEPASNYIDEDDIDWTGDPNKINEFDDDGDCLRIGWPEETPPDFVWWAGNQTMTRIVMGMVLIVMLNGLLIRTEILWQ